MAGHDTLLQMRGGGSTASALSVPLQRIRATRPNRTRNALLGGLIGGAVGIVTCTGISNAVKDAGTGFSTCTTDGYLAFSLGGAAVGALIGALLK